MRLRFWLRRNPAAVVLPLEPPEQPVLRDARGRVVVSARDPAVRRLFALAHALDEAIELHAAADERAQGTFKRRMEAQEALRAHLRTLRGK